MSLPLRLLLLLNAGASLAAGVVLFLWPAAIPATVGIALPPEAAFLARLLGASELALAALAALALRARSAEALRLAALTLIALHAASALADALALAAGPVVLANLLARVALVALLWWFGVRRGRG